MGLFAGLQQYKAALHVHTTASDGAVPLDTMIEAYYARDYDLLAITDHNLVTQTWREPPLPHGLTAARGAEIATGSDRGNRPMLRIPDTTEQSRSAAPADHINTFMTDHLSTDWPTLLTAVANQDGLAHINHLGRYVTNPTQVGRYIELLTDYPYCVGIEMISTHYLGNNDRRHWDNINSATIPEGRTVWGFATDDAHTLSEVGQCYTILVMPELSLTEFRQAMHTGSFYGVALRSSFEGVTTPVGPPPRIIDIEVSAAEITIVAENYHRIDWITEGSVVIGDGDTLSITRVRSLLGSFVRATVIGPGGVAFTQPLRIAPVVKDAGMPLEVMSRMHVLATPEEDLDVVRKVDLADISAGVGFFSFEQDSGNLYFVFDLGVRDDMFEYDDANGNLYYTLPEAS